jgi:hypothetical protein
MSRGSGFYGSRVVAAAFVVAAFVVAVFGWAAGANESLADCELISPHAGQETTSGGQRRAAGFLVIEAASTGPETACFR